MSQPHASAPKINQWTCVFTVTVTWVVVGMCSWDSCSSEKVTLLTHKQLSPMCEEHMILWLQRVTATYPCGMTPCVQEALPLITQTY